MRLREISCLISRYEVFSDEQGYSRELEVDECVPPSDLADVVGRYDETALHLLALEGERPIGTVRLMYPPSMNKYKLGRLAVRKSGRGKGVAQRLVSALGIAAKEMGAEAIYAGSQVPVRGLYEKCGYECIGEEYLDQGQPHIWMVKSLV